MNATVGRSLSIVEIMGILPHRYPFLLIDRITELEPRVRARGYKNVTSNEPFFQGHFPGAPLMPGVLMIEALAQLGGTIMMNADDLTRRTPFLTGIDKAKFRRPVVPGDRLDMEATLLRSRTTMGWIAAVAKVDGKIAVSAELMFSLGSVADFTFDAAVLHE